MKAAWAHTLIVMRLIALSVAAAARAELPPAGAQPVSAIVKAVEARGLGTITAVEFDDGLWEVRIRDGATGLVLYVDPMNGEEKRRRRSSPDDERPPPNAKPLSEVLLSLERGRFGIIFEVEFDDGYWEVEARPAKGEPKKKVKIHPVSGEPRPK
jgi:hypothetical protein